jgi:UDP-N-acetylglucosamine 2-epimerase (non-hydrolysing)
MLKVLSVFGTRPEAIKMAPVVKELQRRHAWIESRVCVTAQHRAMLDQVLDLFDIQPDHDLNLMHDTQSPAQVAAAVMAKLEPILTVEQPDWVLVHGDTTTTMIAALASFYSGTKVGHVEAGLRTFDNQHPFPEEVNRRVAGVVADVHFAPTRAARQNLLRENVRADQILVTGNTVIDALKMVADRPYDRSQGPLAGIPGDRRIVLVTSHRRENFGQPLENICNAVHDIASAHDDVHVVYSVHPNPRVQQTVHRVLGGVPNVTLLPPLEYLPMVHLLKSAHLVLTDSGGLQEEAPSLGKPVLVLRDVTERPEAVEAGTVRLVGTDRAWIRREAGRLLNDHDEHARMARAINPYGDGHAAQRIVNALIASEDVGNLGEVTELRPRVDDRVAVA